MQLIVRAAFLAALVVCVVDRAQGGLIASTDRATFDSFLAPSQEITFDSLAPGTVIPSGGSVLGVTFSYSISGGFQVMVTDAFDAPSPANSLGTNDGGDALVDGDDLTFSFDPSRGFGLFIIGNAVDMLDGDITLTVGATVASLNTAAVQQTLGDGGTVWFLGIQETDPAQFFTTATLETNGPGGAFVYNLDNFVLTAQAVPEPGSATLALFGAAGLWWRRRKTSSTVSKSRLA